MTDKPKHRLTPGDYIAAGFDPPHWDERPWTTDVLREQEEIDAKVQAWRQSVTDEERAALHALSEDRRRAAMIARLRKHGEPLGETPDNPALREALEVLINSDKQEVREAMERLKNLE